MPGTNPSTPTRRNTTPTARAAFCTAVRPVRVPASVEYAVGWLDMCSPFLVVRMVCGPTYPLLSAPTPSPAAVGPGRRTASHPEKRFSPREAGTRRERPDQEDSMDPVHARPRHQRPERAARRVVVTGG